MTAAMAAVTFCACTSVDCPVENTVAARYTLQKADGTQDTLRDTLTIFTCNASGADTVLLNKSVDTKSFQLPVSYVNNADTLMFVRKSETYEIVDTVWIEKTNLPQFESVDCYLVYFHDVMSVKCTHNGIDSVAINKARIDYDSNTENLHLYFKASL